MNTSNTRSSCTSSDTESFYFACATGGGHCSAFCASRSHLCWSSFRKDRPLLGGVIAFVESLLWCVRVQSSCVCVHFRVSSSTACVRVVPSGTFGTRSGNFRLGVRLLYFLLPSPFLRRQGICLRCTLERVLRVVQHPFERVIAKLCRFCNGKDSVCVARLSVFYVSWNTRLNGWLPDCRVLRLDVKHFLILHQF